MNKLTTLIFFFVLLGYNCMSQKEKLYMFDKTDPFSNERKINYGNAYINEFAQVGIELKIKDSLKTYGIVFMIPYQNIVSEGGDSTIKECRLKISTGQVINGKWVNTTHAAVMGQTYTGFSYQFSEIDFHTLMGANITTVKMNQYTYEVPDKNQKKIGELINRVQSQLLSKHK